MSGLKFVLSDMTSFLPDNLSGLKKIYIQAWISFFPNLFKITEWKMVYFLYTYI